MNDSHPPSGSPEPLAAQGSAATQPAAIASEQPQSSDPVDPAELAAAAPIGIDTEVHLDHTVTLSSRVRTILIGKPRDLSDHSIFHSLSLVAFLAWVGLGADGLSSSCYGPSEAFKTLQESASRRLPFSCDLSGPGQRRDGVHHLGLL